MHNAPSVSYPVGRSRFLLLLLCVPALAGVLAVAAWLALDAAAPWRLALAAFACTVLPAWCFAWWLRMPAGLLEWDGERWSWSTRQGRRIDVSLEVTLDLQRSLLLRCRAAAAPGWVWLDRSVDPRRWDDVRRAVYSRATPEAPPADASAAKP